MKIALIHDQLQEFGGAERVLIALKQIFPEADVYTSFYNPQTLGSHADKFKDWHITTSWADKIPFLKTIYSPLRWITPWIWESFDFSQYDVVISSSGAYMCKGIITRPHTTHISYLHHQPKYLYYYETAREWQKYLLIRVYGHFINHGLRLWDFIASQRPDHFIVNSQETQRRCRKFYRRESQVIYPPVNIPEVDSIKKISVKRKEYYLTISRLNRAKNIDLLIHAANMYHFPLKVVGKGIDEQSLRKIADSNVEIIGEVSDEQLNELYAGAKAFLFAAIDEEFGIAPVEALGHKLPVIAYSSGGIKETIHNGKNGYLFHYLTEENLHEQIQKLEQLTEKEYLQMAQQAYISAQQYSFTNFKKQLMSAVKKLCNV